MIFYKTFLLDSVPVYVLGSLSGAYGDEIRAFKKDSACLPLRILEGIPRAYDFLGLPCTAVLTIPSNKSQVMDFFLQQSALLLGLEPLAPLKMIKPIKEQKFLETRKERKGNVSGVFQAENIEALKQHPFFLIDDVYASGETLKEALKLLLSLKAPPKFCLIFAYRDDFPR